MRLLLVDGHYYAYRSFFAIRGLTNPQGEPTNAVFGFVKALRKMLADVQPTAAAVVWDAGLPERRMTLLPTYKQQRAETPEDLRVQFPVIEDAVAALGVSNVRLPEHEADDLIASYATAAQKSGTWEVVIATNDKDIYALVEPGVMIYSTNKTDLENSPSGFALLGMAEVEKKWGVLPKQIPDVLALTGDTVDNIPGVEGIGPKTAAKLVRDYGGVTQLLENPSVIQNDKLQEKVSKATPRLRDNLELVRLENELPLPVSLDALSVRPNAEAIIAIARRCAFRSLLAEYQKSSQPSHAIQGELFAE